MRPMMFAVAALAVALALSACGSTHKYVAGTPQATAQAEKGLNDPRTTHIKCLRADGVTDLRGHPSFQVGRRPSRPTVVFLPTPGAAQYVQIAGEDQAAEPIGSAQVYPNLAPAGLAHKVETCVALGVSG
jgi:hypothetical protein